MEFYTCVNLYGNSILYRGYKDNERVIKRVNFEPTLYLPKSYDTGLYSINGVSVEPVSFSSISDARKFCDTYSDVQNMSVYGNQNYVSQFLLDKYPNDIEFDLSKVNISTIDIEVESDSGFPHPDQANHEVTAICVHNTNDDVFYLWATVDYDTTKSIVKDTNDVVFKKCESESRLLMDFLTFWSNEKTSPDVVTGWNIRIFDVPYLVNRIRKVLGESSAKRMSPWGVVKERNVRVKNKNLDAYDLVGLQQLDYLDIFQKFTSNTLGNQESYRLDHIAHVVLGERKLSYEEHSSLNELYRNDPQKFLDYNCKDVQLVQRLEEKLGIISLVATMAYRAGVNFSDTLGTTAIWDSIIYRDLAKSNTVVPPSISKPKADFPGGYVKDPVIGLHDWIVSFDLNSLYPSIIVQWNMSPETVLPERMSLNVDKALNDKIEEIPDDTTVAVNGAMFLKNKEGVIPGIVKNYYANRKELKTKMLKTKQELENVDKTDANLVKKLERDIARYDNEQMAIKILLNSVFGALGNPYFRYTNLSVAEAITTTGQMVIRWSERAINNKLDSLLKKKRDRVIAIDTDSVVGNSVISVNGKKINIEDYYDRIDNNFIKNDQFNDDYVKVVDNGDTTQSINKDGKLENKPINYIMKHRVRKEMFRIDDSSGNSVIVTEDHSVIVRDKKTKEILDVKPKELNPKKHEIINIIANDTDSGGIYGVDNRK